MEYHEFDCEGASALFIATADPDPGRIPGAAQLPSATPAESARKPSGFVAYLGDSPP